MKGKGNVLSYRLLDEASVPFACIAQAWNISIPITVLWKALGYFSNNHNHYCNKCVEETEFCFDFVLGIFKEKKQIFFSAK